MRKVEVLPYNKQWPDMFQLEADLLKEVLGAEILDIYHIGSTAIEGLHAKPIIDIMPVVKNITTVDSYNEEMIAIRYEPKGENGIKNRRFFQKGGNNRSHHVHIYERYNPEIVRHLAFRDYLRKYPLEAKQYGDRKIVLAKQYAFDINSYIKGKEKMVKEMEQRALIWHEHIR
ncbi:GrpB family protein [Alkalihalobacillus sp. MEB130]|uniref:GrpB family protein n=1 Tax=Alkalihalobacillus sp. MEB130 TaxID=2976704 RepID=UPI0028DDCED8|nr:GrpB family protein [Alkalihalobacillus sp. MEB130]MDT8861181.1 GrpB family protein [Alkalihalobacillus sp. MEB130]